MNKNQFLNIVDSLNNSEKAILDYFGYEHGWHVFPIEYQLGSSWMLNGNTVVYADEPFTSENIEAGTIYTAAVDSLSPSVWRGKDFTMILADTRCDRNVFLMIFGNENECTDSKLKQLCEDHW